MATDRKGLSPIDAKVHSTTFKEKDAVVQAVLSKLITPKGKEGSTEHQTSLPTQNELSPIMRDTMQRSIDADYIFEVLPDLEMVAQIAISSILSSKDLITTSVNYDCDTTDLAMELRTNMVKVIASYFDDEYKFPGQLYDILYDVMFKTGSYATAVIPESSVDKLINSGRGPGIGTEAFNKSISDKFRNKGILGSSKDKPTDVVGLEALFSEPLPLNSEDSVISFGDSEWGKVHITDNPEMLKVQELQRTLAKTKIKDTYDNGQYRTTVNTAAEAHEEKDIGEKESSMNGTADGLRKYNNTQFDDSAYGLRDIEEVAVATDTDTPSIGHPLVMHMPSESVIPVHVPGDLKMHVGYLVLLDKLGNPVSRHDLMNTTQAWSWINGDATSSLIKSAAEGLGLGNETQEKWTISKLTNSYADLVERKLINSINNGVYGDSATVARPQEVYRIMMARSLAKKSTQILYIPSEQFSYYAFDYTDTGIGRSLTDKNKIITAGRAALQFATLQSSILNATRNMDYTITLAPEDREPEKTIDDAQHRIMQGYGGRIPFTGSINDMEAYFTNAGISFNIEGNDYYPSTKIAVSDNTPDYKVPDESIDKELARRNYRGYGIDPDLVMDNTSIEFATQILSKDLLATKQTCKLQEKLAPLMTHFTKTYIISSGTLLEKLAKEVTDYYSASSKKLQKGEIGKSINIFLGSLKTTLPPPDMSMLASQMDSYKEFSEAIDEIIRVNVDEDFLGESGLDIDLRRAQSMLGNYAKRDWFKRNGVETVITNMFEESGDARQDMIKSIADDNVKIAELILMAIKRTDKRVTTVAERYTEEEANEFGDGDGGLGDGATDEFGGDDALDGDTGGDDFDIDADGGGEGLSDDVDSGGEGLDEVDDDAIEEEEEAEEEL